MDNGGWRTGGRGTWQYCCVPTRPLPSPLHLYTVPIGLQITSMLSLDTLCDLFQQSRSLIGSITLDQLSTYIRLASYLKNEILYFQKPTHNREDVPENLPPNVKVFLGEALRIEPSEVEKFWTIFGMSIWQGDTADRLSKSDEALFREHGIQNNLSKQVCMNTRCNGNRSSPRWPRSVRSRQYLHQPVVRES
jgi:hypothetical protein